ncbi:MAG: DUF1738 domain-containing protein [Fusobacterium necrophorum]|nr:DUF1738 domain-containing protein [Fusobacterium necrophorum]
MKKSKSYEIVMENRKKLVKEIIQNLEKKKFLFEKPWNIEMLSPQNPISKLHYLGGNHLRLINQALQHEYKDPRWMTFKQAEENGWHVKKGEKGTLCEKWIFIITEKEKEETSGKIKEIEVVLEKPIVSYFYVFNGEQIDGIPTFQLSTKTKEEKFQQANIVIKSSECPIVEVAQTNAFYNPKEDKIVLPLKESFEEEESFLATVFHEMIHSTGHETRLHRELTGKFGTEAYAREELTAELGSMFLQGRLGIPLEERHFENHQAYLQSWIEVLKKDSNELFRAASQAEKATERIYERYLQQEKGLEQNKQDMKKKEEKTINSKTEDYWVVEFHERSSQDKNYTGKILSLKLIQEIKELDQFYANEKGYSKFYFDHIQKGKVMEHLRIDVGDGNKCNRLVFDYLSKEIERIQNQERKLENGKEKRKILKKRKERESGKGME